MDRIIEDACFVVSREAISCPLGEGLALLDTRSNSYFSLNVTGALVWDQARSPVSFRELRASMMERFDCDAERCDEDLRALLGALLDAGLLQTATQGHA